MTTNPIKKTLQQKSSGGGGGGGLGGGGQTLKRVGNIGVLHKIPTILGRLLARLLQVYWSINFKLLKKKYK